MIRILSFILFFQVFAYGEDFGLKGVTPEDQTILEANRQSINELKEQLTLDQIQKLYDSGNLIKAINIHQQVIKSEGNVEDAVNNNLIKQAINSNPYAGMDPKEVEGILEERTKGTRVGAIFEKIPRMKRFMSHWLTHEDAMPRFYKLIENKKKLMNVGVFAIIIMVLSFLVVEKWTSNEPLMFMRILKRWIARVATLWMCLFLFYFVFRYEVGPTVQIFKKYFIFTTA